MFNLRSKLARRLMALFLMSISPVHIARGDNFTWEQNVLSTNWDSAFNWAGTPNAFPDDNTDSATVQNANAIPTLTSNRTIGALTIRSGGDVLTGNGTNNYALTIQESLSQNGRTLIENVGSSLTVRQSPMSIDFDTDDLIINAGGSIFLNGGAKVQVDRLATLNPGGQIAGNGVFEFNGQNNFYNDGIIRASGGGTLHLTSNGPTTVDLDGVGENGILIADTGSTLRITTATNGHFDGVMYIHQGGTFEMTNPLHLNNTPGSEIHFYGVNGAATLASALNNIFGVVDIHSGTAVFATDTVIQDTATMAIRQGTTVQFDAPAFIEHPERVVNQYNTNIVVNGPVTIGSGFGNFNWDGDAQNQVLSGHTIINHGGSLNLNVGRVEQAGTEEVYSGSITMNSGNIDVQNADGEWEMRGFLHMNNTANQVPVLSGANILMSGSLVVGGTGASAIRANTTFNANSDVYVQGGAKLRLGTFAAGSQTILAGGEWTGAGTVDLDAATTIVTAATTIDMPFGAFDLDGTGTGDQLVLNAPLTLNVQKMDDDLNNVVNDDLRINSAGRLAMNLTSPHASYGIAGPLELNGLGGALSSLHFTGSDVRLQGTTLVTGNSATSARTEIVGQMNIAGAGTFQFRGGTADDPSWVRAGALVTGTGDLVVSSIGPGYLRIEDHATVGVELVNRGTVDLGPAAANATVAAFTQMATGTYVASIDGLSSDTQYDQLDVNGVANLNGTLRVEVNQFGGSYSDPITPGVFDEFELILAAAMTGKFNAFVYDGISLLQSFSSLGQDRFHVGAGLFRVLDYDATEMDLLNYRALLGDANGDGLVDGSDYGIWNANKFTAGTDWTTGDFNGDGVTDGADFGIWNSNKFTGVALGRPGPVSLQAVPEPNGLWTVVAGLFALAFRNWFRQTRSVVALN